MQNTESDLRTIKYLLIAILICVLCVLAIVASMAHIDFVALFIPVAVVGLIYFFVSMLYRWSRI